MTKNIFKIISKTILLSSLVMLAYSCTDGTDGINGTNGTNGLAGANGTNGTNGTNGMGFEDATTYGSVKTTTVRAENSGISFSQESTFNYTSGSLIYSSSVYEWVNTANQTNLEFRIEREGTFGDYDNTIYLSLSVNNFTASTPTYSLYLESYFPVMDSEGKYFSYSSYMDDSSNANIIDFSITEFSYDKTTKNLKFKYSYKDTNNMVTSAGTVDVIVVETIATP